MEPLRYLHQMLIDIDSGSPEPIGKGRENLKSRRRADSALCAPSRPGVETLRLEIG